MSDNVAILVVTLSVALNLLFAGLLWANSLPYSDPHRAVLDRIDMVESQKRYFLRTGNMDEYAFWNCLETQLVERAVSYGK